MTTAPDTAVVWPLLGQHRRRARVALAALVALSVSIVLADFVPKLLLTSDQQPRLLWFFNGIAGAILIVVVCTPILGIVYGLWNRGPLLAFSIPVVPALVGTLLSGRLLLTTDLALALSAGATAAVLGTVRLWLAAVRTPPAARAPAESLGAGLGFSTFSVVVAGGVFRAVATTAGPHMSFGVRASGVLLAVGAVFLVLVGCLAFSSRLRAVLS